MFNKIFLATTVAVVSASVATPASAYASFEYPFRNNVGYMDQQTGDNACRNYFNNAVGRAADSMEPLIYIRENVVLNYAWHVWYHQRNQQCIANIGE